MAPLVQRVSVQTLFLMDGLGALFSALVLGLCWSHPRLQPFIGMPVPALHGLAGFACALAAYSLLNWRWQNPRWKPYMQLMAVANLLYCCVSVGLVLCYYHPLTRLGVLYFGLEKLVVVALAISELRMAAPANEAPRQSGC